MNSKKIKEVCKKVSKDLMKLSPEELKKQIDEHVPGDMYNFLMDTGAAELIVKDLEKRNAKKASLV